MNRSRAYRATRCFWCLATIAALGPLFVAAAEPELDPAIDWAHLQDPQIVLPRIEVNWPESLPRLWQKALEHREADVQREAADSITRAHQLGMPVPSAQAETLIKSLSNVLDDTDQHPVARIAAARALVQIDARQSAALLAQHSARGPIALSQLAEPALARWDYQPQRDVWLQRLAQGSRPALLELAIQGLATVGEERAIPDLTRLASSAREPSTVRLSAAHALASLRRDGLEELAGQLAKKSGPAAIVDRLVAARLLAHHTGDSTLALLEQLADDAEPAVAALAMQRMLEIAPDRLIARAEKSLAHRDARIRHLALEALATGPSPQAIAQLAPQLNDPVVENRVLARRTLLKMAGDEQLHGAVVQHTTQILQGNDWRGLEQAILILTALHQVQAGDRYLALLDHARPEVFVTAAWGLRKLAVPDLTEPMFAVAQKLSERVKKGTASIEHSTQLAQLLEAMGERRHTPAEAHLRIYIPKSPGGQPFSDQVRTSAIWSLGLLLDGKSDPALAKQLEERLADSGSIPPESLPVRSLSAITMGRLKSEPSLPELRKWYEVDTHNNYLGRCCGWAIERIAGEKLPDPDVLRPKLQNWFLEPLDKERP